MSEQPTLETLLGQIETALEKLRVAVECDKRYYDSTLSRESREIVQDAAAGVKAAVKLLREKLGLPKGEM